MSVQPEFGSVNDADSAYYGDDGGGGGGGSGSWGDLQEEPTDWQAGWGLFYQVNQDDDRRRYFDLRGNNGQLEAINSSGQVEQFPQDTSLEEVPHYPAEGDARDAYQTWAEANAGQDGSADSENWGEWQRLEQVDVWWIWTREHQTEDRVQFIVAGENDAGESIYLHPGGAVKGDAHIFDSPDAVQSALNAYYQRVEEGDVPASEQPTGNSPKKEQIEEDAQGAGGALGGVLDLVGGPMNAVLLGGAAAGAAYLATNEDVDLGGALDG